MAIPYLTNPSRKTQILQYLSWLWKFADIKHYYTKSTDLGKTSVINKLSQEPSPILEKLFNYCVKEKCFPGRWKGSTVYFVYKNPNELSSSLQCRYICLFSVASKFFEAIIMKAVYYLNRNNRLSEKQYIFCSSRPTADVFTVIKHRLIVTPDDKSTMRAITLNISKVFDKMWNRSGSTQTPYCVIKSVIKLKSVIIFP